MSSSQNALTSETSPYLLQHADNPVQWYPWGEEALQLAHETGKPILLSIGYSACHWCHVMAHESFEHDDTAALRGVAIFAKVCFGHPSPSKQQKLHATVYACGAPTADE
ncbi:DUF255 domain-containing protein [Solemya pervernicosa gill symbiont]|uniref:DUF255 domain-containing protein n=1 Tax=Solemya pervernicosa gill symbiont TaxID=642797 RepID=UPI0026A9968A